MNPPAAPGAGPAMPQLIVVLALWDITGVPWTAFIPIGLCGCGLTVFGAALTLRNVHD